MTRAYFTAATCAISLCVPLSVKTPSKKFSLGRIQMLYTIRKYSNLIPNNKALTIWNKPLGFSSKFNKMKLTKEESLMIQLTIRVRSILIGLLLSDGYLQKRNDWNPRIGLKQSIINFPFLWSTFREISYLCSGTIMLSSNILRDKLFNAVTIQTRQLACIIPLFNLFYVENGNLWKKVIKPELLFYMNYIVLAYWIMGDGSKRNEGVTLYTDGFTLQEVVLLINILIIKFNINPTIHKEKKAFRIYINKIDLNKIRPHITPYFVEHFLYKIT